MIELLHFLWKKMVNLSWHGQIIITWIQTNLLSLREDTGGDRDVFVCVQVLTKVRASFISLEKKSLFKTTQQTSLCLSFCTCGLHSSMGSVLMFHHHFVTMSSAWLLSAGGLRGRLSMWGIVNTALPSQSIHCRDIRTVICGVICPTEIFILIWILNLHAYCQHVENVTYALFFLLQYIQRKSKRHSPQSKSTTLLLALMLCMCPNWP